MAVGLTLAFGLAIGVVIGRMGVKRQLIAAFRDAVLGRAIPWDMLAYAAPVCVAIFLLGCFYYRKVEDTFADVI